MAAVRFSDKVFAVVRRIPRGKVASYGLVGALAGHPRAARQVGMVMKLSHGLPWWRVLAADGRIAVQNPELRFAQHARLESEGVPVRAGRVDMERHGWKPRVTSGRGIGASAKRGSRPSRPERRPRS